jgi:hypothetical protein
VPTSQKRDLSPQNNKQSIHFSYSTLNEPLTKTVSRQYAMNFSFGTAIDYMTTMVRNLDTHKWPD